MREDGEVSEGELRIAGKESVGGGAAEMAQCRRTDRSESEKEVSDGCRS